jgi:hypothetical protein
LTPEYSQESKRSGTTGLADVDAGLRTLRSADAVRARCAVILTAAHDGRLDHFSVHPEKLDAAADYVLAVIRDAYPGLNIPYHSRWRHFETGGVDRWARLAAGMPDAGPAERARRRFDLAVTSVLLDAGAGPDWRYREAVGGTILGRSEGLAAASLEMFADGLFSADPADPCRADAGALARLTKVDLARGFQAGPDNPLAGLAGRAALLGRLGGCLSANPALFGADPPRPGGLFDHLAARARDGAIAAEAVLGCVLGGFADIWPGRLTLGGANLGDVWRHGAIRTGDLTDGLVPFHKLSQWLAYSLVEPLEEAGIAVTGLDELTGLAEYRNGGLLIDTGVLRPRDPALLATALAVESEAVVEWRALTVALLDGIAVRIRAALGLDAGRLPLAKVLEGGTWVAGRRIARETRPGGGPPIQVVSDGTVF